MTAGLSAELPGSCNLSFLQTNMEHHQQSSLAFLAPFPNLAGAEPAFSLVSTSWPEPKQAISSGAVAGPHYLKWSGNLLSTTSYGRERTEVTSLLEGKRLDSGLHPFASELVAGFWLSHSLGSSPGSKAPPGPKAYVTLGASLVSKLQTIWAVTSLGETFEEHDDMAI